MKKINIRKFYYRVKTQYLTMNNIVMVVALLIGVCWTWNSVNIMQRNYGLQREVNTKKKNKILLELHTLNLTYEQNYYKSREYQEYALRDRLGLALSGEKALILPANSAKAKNADAALDKELKSEVEELGNFEQWINFLFGGK